jgi:uncharacterized protein (DUF1015 family)
MAEINAFRAFRYDLARVDALGDVVAPPYDVIDPPLQDALYAKSPYNVIRLELNKETPADSDSNNRYTRAAGHLRDWLAEGVLTQDAAPALYVYHQQFEVEGRTFTRKGFMARVRLEKIGEGKIYPHEETMPGPKADRLKLMHATAMNLSQVFGLFPDEEDVVQDRLEQAVLRTPPLQATDHLGVVNRLWPVTDSRVIHEVSRHMHDKPVFIADGHHRYETALRYLDERRQAGAVRDAAAPANFVLMMLVSMSDPGLVILPTHRLVSGLNEVRAERLRELLSGSFEVEVVGQGDQAARDTWELIQAADTQDVLGLGTVADGVWQLARFQAPRRMAELAPQHSPVWRGLAVSVLHELVLNQLLAQGLGGAPKCRYVHLLGEVTAAVRARECGLAVLVPPATMRHVEEIAGQGEKMPPKSTYFYPKLLSGLVFHSLKGGSSS